MTARRLYAAGYHPVLGALLPTFFLYAMLDGCSQSRTMHALLQMLSLLLEPGRLLVVVRAFQEMLRVEMLSKCEMQVQGLDKVERLPDHSS